ncbi:MAG: CRTAC1 family protein, partial [Flavobacteriales bacterium]
NGELIDVTEQANLIQNSLAWTQGACWGDYDRDGFLDLYVSNYNWNTGIDNWLYHNNGDGTFTETAQELGVSNGSCPTFQAVFMDYNNDLWPDIFVINDRIPTNAMYRNNGDGSFTDVTYTAGVNHSIDAMTASVCDFDKDGDQDIYVTNGPNGNLFLENDNGVYLNTAPGTALEVNTLSWGATWIDFNNNGYEDLYVCTESPFGENENRFFKNGPTGLSPNQNAFNGSNSFSAHSSAKADFNCDGKQDLVVHASSPDNARLFINQGEAGNSVQIQLEGVISNKDGVGSWVTSYFNGTSSCVFTMCGGGYMAQDSQYLTIGIGSNEILDRVEIQWPSGQFDSFSDLLPGSLIKLVEGSSEITTINHETTSICEGDSLYLEISGGNSPIWSNGTQANGLWVNEPGE